MNLICQHESLTQLEYLAQSDRHSILIEGPAGCGKTYLSKIFSGLVNSEDYIQVASTVQDIKSTLDECYNLDQKVVVCIENLDSGSLGASYTLLKFLEEPNSNVYVVVTCSNVQKIPDTIISRSSVVSISPPVPSDIAEYAESKDRSKYIKYKDRDIWKCVRTFRDIDLVYSMTSDQLDYYSNLDTGSIFKDTVANTVWRLGHYSDNSETPVEFVIRYILCSTSDSYLKRICSECVSDISNSRLAKHAVLTKFSFEGKYGE